MLQDRRIELDLVGWLCGPPLDVFDQSEQLGPDGEFIGPKARVGHRKTLAGTGLLARLWAIRHSIRRT